MNIKYKPFASRNIMTTSKGGSFKPDQNQISRQHTQRASLEEDDSCNIIAEDLDSHWSIDSEI